MDVLVHLASRPGTVVSRDELVAAVWDGLEVTDGAVTRSVGAIRKALGDDARRPQYLATVPKRGYRLLGVNAAGANGPRRPCRPILLGVGALALLALFILPRAGSEDLTIGLRPFDALDELASREGWERGLTADIATRLVPVPELAVGLLNQENSAGVAGSASAAAYDLVLSGSVRRQDEMARVSCQLFSPHSEHVLCAGSCDLSVGDRLGAHAEAADRIVAAVIRASGSR